MKHDMLKFSNFLPELAKNQENFQVTLDEFKDIISSEHFQETSLSTSLHKISDNFFSQFDFIKIYLQNIVQDNTLQHTKEVISNKLIMQIGLDNLKLNIFHRPISNLNCVPVIDPNYWVKLLDYIGNQPKFEDTLGKLRTYYKNILDKKIDEELQKVPIDIDKEIENQYRTMYYSNPLTFQAFIDIEEKKNQDNDIYSFDEDNDDYNSSSSVSKDNSEGLRHKFEQAIEKKKTDKMKKEQEKSFDNYENYFDMSERELNRAKRKSSSRRKYNKQSRRKKY